MGLDNLPDPIRKMLACLIVLVGIGSCIGSIFSLVLAIGQSDTANKVASRAGSMTAKDFESIDAGCTIVRTNRSTYTYAYSNSKCSSNCYSAYACSERRVHEFRINSDNQAILYTSAPEDNLVKVDDMCENPENIWVTEEGKFGQIVPCWRPIDADAITRNERLPNDPRMASYEGIAACGHRCATTIGYHCGNSECVKILDPASEREFYAGYTSPSQSFYIGLATGFLAVMVMWCTAGTIYEKLCPCCPCKVCQDDDDDD
jgi:hypothetical protein